MKAENFNLRDLLTYEDPHVTNAHLGRYCLSSELRRVRIEALATEHVLDLLSPFPLGLEVGRVSVTTVLPKGSSEAMAISGFILSDVQSFGRRPDRKLDICNCLS